MADVTRKDAICFCNAAMRNWQYVSFDESELEDLRIELQRYRTTALAAKEAELAAEREKVEKLREALEGLANREQEYRIIHDTKGDGSREAGRAWDLMRRAGTIARATLAETQP